MTASLPFAAIHHYEEGVTKLSNLDTIRNHVPEYILVHAMPCTTDARKPGVSKAMAAELSGTPDIKLTTWSTSHVLQTDDWLAQFDWERRLSVGSYLPPELIAIDCDSEEAIAEFDAICPVAVRAHAPVQRRKQGKMHFFMRLPEQLVGQVKCLNGLGESGKIDLKGMGKGWIVLAPTERPDDPEHPYTMRSLWPEDINDIPMIPPQVEVWLHRQGAIGRNEEAPERAADERPRHDRVRDLAFNLARESETVDELRTRVEPMAHDIMPPERWDEVEHLIQTGWDGNPQRGTRLRRYQVNSEGFALLFAHEYGDDVAYVVEEKSFYYFNGVCWEKTDDTFVIARFTALSKRMATQAFTHPTEDPLRAQKLKVATALSNIAHVNRGVTQLRAARRCSIDTFDARPEVVVFSCGTCLDLETSTAWKATPADRFTRTMGVAYQPDATCPKWDAFITSALPADAHDFMQKLFGTALDGRWDAAKKRLAFLYGISNTGKSTTLNVLAHVFGEYAAMASFKSLVGNDRDAAAASSDIYAWRGKRFIMTDEIPEQAKLDAKMKSLTGGEPITARPLFRDPVTFEPQHMIFASGNKEPEIDVTDSGLLNRLYPVPFDRVITKAPGERELIDVLREEGAGIAVWLLRGYFDAKADGLTEPASMVAAREAYAKAQNPLDEWFELMFEPHNITDVYVEQPGLHAEMLAWWANQGLPTSGRDAAPKKQLFHRLCDQRFGCGVTQVGPRNKRTRGWPGVRRRTETAHGEQFDGEAKVRDFPKERPDL